MKQRDLARGLGIDPAAVSRLKAKGMPGDSVEAAAAWRRANVAPYIRSGDAGDDAGGTAEAAAAAPPLAHGEPTHAPGPRLDLAQERAWLAREQRIAVEMRNAITRGEYAPIQLLGEVLAGASQAVAERFDHLPGQLRKSCPDLPQQALDQVMKTIAEARNEWVRQTVELVTAAIVATDEEPESALQDDGEEVAP